MIARAMKIRNRKPRKMDMRGRWLLERLAAFCSKRGWWPTAPELTSFTGRGSRWTTWRGFAALQRRGFVAMEKRRWAITDKGFSYLGHMPFYARLAHKPSKKTVAERRRRKKRVLAAWARWDLTGAHIPYERFVEHLALREDIPVEG